MTTKISTAPYDRVIREIMTEMGITDEYDPRHIEAFIRADHPTLDHLTRPAFRKEVKIAIQCIDIGGKENAELIAQSYGW